jgi:hypothetical protein
MSSTSVAKVVSWEIDLASRSVTTGRSPTPCASSQRWSPTLPKCCRNRSTGCMRSRHSLSLRRAAHDHRLADQFHWSRTSIEAQKASTLMYGSWAAVKNWNWNRNLQRIERRLEASQGNRTRWIRPNRGTQFDRLFAIWTVSITPPPAASSDVTTDSWPALSSLLRFLGGM